MTKQNNRNLLWADDDAPGRFPYEARLIKSAGWDLQWSADVLGTAELLATNSYRALILDQMLPISAEIEQSPHLPKALPLWSGCLLLRWLRGATLPKAAPAGVQNAWDALAIIKPLPTNRRLPVLVVSAFSDKKVTASIRSASKQDHGIDIVTKPAAEEDILDFLRALEAGAKAGS